jgi:outer membrane protein OmpA-like peptidoglycan-associated protein
MRKKILLPFMLSLIILFPSFLSAGQLEFQSTSQEMIDILKQEPVRYRSFTAKKRAIVVVEKKQEKMEKTTIYVDESVEIPKVKTLIHFDYNSARLRPDSYSLLDEVGKALNAPEIRNKPILINGHTDSDGTEEYNLHLSYQRARAVQQYLTGTCRVPENRLKIRGYGESVPLKSNVCPETKQINRRVEFEIAQ